MSIAAKYNKGGINWNIDTTNFEYHSLEDAGEGTEIQVRGLYINTKGKFGPSPVLITDHCFYNLPGHMTDTVKNMLQDPELINAIIDGHVAADVRTFIDGTYNRKCWTVDWKDI